MNRYRKGYRFERRIMAELQEAGALVMRSAGSHGAADLVAMFSGDTVAVQCKSAKPPRADREKVRAASERTSVGWLLVWPHEGRVRFLEWKDGTRRCLGAPVASWEAE